MPTISFNQGAMDTINNRFTGQILDDSYSHIALMSGTMPSDFTSIPATGSGNNTWTSDYAGQMLWINQLSSEWSTPSGQNIMTLNTNYTQARLTGTAEWFWCFKASGNDPETVQRTISYDFIGSVGTSGTDLIVGSTSITSGKYYRVGGLQLSFPGLDYNY